VDSSSFIYLFTLNYPFPQPCIKTYRDPILPPDRYYALPVYHSLVPAHCTSGQRILASPQETPNYPITMSSRTKKSVAFERGNKPTKSHHYHRSRDSGVGSSSASDRASLGTAADSPFTREQVEDQRHILGAVQEALEAANEKIKQLEAEKVKLNIQLAESNKENRLLKREKGELWNKLEDAKDDLDEKDKIIERLSKEPTPRRASEESSSSSSRKSHHRDEKRSSMSGRRSSLREMPVPLYDRHTPPLAPQAPLSKPPNPFAPRGAPLPAATYPLSGPVNYASNGLPYVPGSYVHPSSPVRERHNDGRYHLSPV
jgi:hypothetical protein